MTSISSPASASVSSPIKQNKYTCICCRIKFETADLQRCHFKTEWHLYNLKRRICSLEPIGLDSFESIQAVSPVKDDDQNSILSEVSDFVVVSSKWESTAHESDDDDWERINNDMLLDEDYSSDEADELLAKIIKPNVCLFCDKVSSSMKLNIHHMSSNHGFFIPEERYLIDKKGLMEYLGLKIGAASTCLWCNKQFKTVQGVRLHMLYKDHCKIHYEQAQAIEEFKEYYDYSSQEQFQMKPPEKLVVIKRRNIRRAEATQKSPMNNAGESVDQNQELDTNCKPQIFSDHKVTKKFEANRAKILLRTYRSNNQTMRARLKMQYPI